MVGQEVLADDERGDGAIELVGATVVGLDEAAGGP